MTLLLAAAVDLSILLAVALAVTLVMRHRSAALRHGILAAALMLAAAAPALELILPQWTLPLDALFGAARTELPSTLRFTSDAAPMATAAGTIAQAPAARVSWLTLVAGVWMAGALAGLAGLFTGLVRLARFTARCTPVRSGPWRDAADALAGEPRLSRVQILQSADPSILVTWGLLTPRIILPAGAAEWTAARRRIVLAHEMAHIRRRDWLLQMGAETLRAIHWMNPLAWLACRRLRQESEYACDDVVLSGGVRPTEYATHLLAVARQAAGHRRAWISAPAIAHPSTLERRIAAMLADTRNRQPLTRSACLAAFAIAATVAVPLTALTVGTTAAPITSAPDVILDAAPPAAVTAPPDVIRPESLRPAPAPARIAPAAAAVQQTPAGVSGVISDPSGGVLPGVELRLTDMQSGGVATAVSDGAGRFRFSDITPGRHELVARLPGFATVSNVLSLVAGTIVERRLMLPLGSLQETVTVGCAAPAADAAPSQPITAEREARADGNDAPAAPRREVSVEASRVGTRRVSRIAASAQASPATLPVRVGGQIAVPRPVRRVNPVCPRTVVPAGPTVVVLTGQIGVDGYMNDVRQVPAAGGAAAPLSEFVDAALDAVRQWTFTPTRLNNVPAVVNITVTVQFSR